MPDELAERFVDQMFPELKPKSIDPKAPPTEADVKTLASNPDDIASLYEAVRKHRQLQGNR